ncbi:MAG: hypothetical protein EBE86_020420 [Hormoscilla sp. GUM202]|nr:hypothetical protein [Hormoscilla sp. GUM202]
MEKITIDRGLPVMKTSTQTTPEALQNYSGRSTNKIEICVYLKEDPESISIAKITEFRAGDGRIYRDRK